MTDDVEELEMEASEEQSSEEYEYPSIDSQFEEVVEIAEVVEIVEIVEDVKSQYVFS